MYSEILYEAKDAVATLTLNRPDKRNPLGPTTLGELLHAIERAKADPEVRVIVLTGAGKVFSAGGDLSAFAGRSDGAKSSTEVKPGTFVDLNLAFTRVGKPTVAMVNGHAMAGGLGLVVACDVALASDEAEFSLPEINVGLWPMMISTNIFRNVTRKRGLERMLTGDRITAAEAERIGLITRALPKASLGAETAKLAAKLAAKSPVVMRLGLDAFYATADMALEPALLELQQRLFAVLATEDAREGLQAFLEKRAPKWTGR